MRTLTDKQKRFCQEYVIDNNATQAAIRAGYSEDTARQIGSENLSKLYISDYIAELRKEKSEELNITLNDMLKLELHIAHGGEKDSDKLRAIDQISKKLGFYEKDNLQKKTEVVLPTKIEFTKGARESETI